MTNDEFEELLALTDSIGLETAVEATRSLPNVGSLPTAERFDQMIAAARYRGVGLRRMEEMGIPAQAIAVAQPHQMRALAEELRSTARNRLGTERDAILNPLIARLDDTPGQIRNWMAVIDELNSMIHAIQALESSLRGHHVRIRAGIDDNWLNDMAEIRGRLVAGSRIGLFDRASRRTLAACEVNGHRPATNPFGFVASRESRDAMELIVGGLSEREAAVIKLRFGMADGSRHTLDEIGTVFGVTRERIRQIESKALEKLRKDRVKNALRDAMSAA